MKLSEFVRTYALRSKNIAWLFGAGTSVSAGMPTAGDLVWEFKRRIYCSEEKLSVVHFSNLSDPATRAQIQSYFDSKTGYPKLNSIEEYSFYFELAFSTAIDRSTFLMNQLSNMQLSFGHKAIGILIKNNLLPVIFTTNFDKAFENATVEQLKSVDKYLVADLDNTTTAIQKYNSGFRPIIVKIHGDYFSEQLKNTSKELQDQDRKLRQVLLNSCLTNGLAVMGYSGRDESIMDVLREAINSEGAFSNGLFWFIRPGSKPLPEVEDLIQKAKAKGIHAEFVEIDTFDTAWAEIVKGFPSLSVEDLTTLNTNYFRTAPANISTVGKNFPVIRLNACKIESFPSTARLIKCDAGNTKELKELIQKNNSELLAIRKQSGVVGFGSDQEFDKILGVYGTLQKDVYSITDKMLHREDSVIKGMITEALLKAICFNSPLKNYKKRGSYFIHPDRTQLTNSLFSGLKKELNHLFGKIPNSNSYWIAALEISIQIKFSQLLLVLKPTIISSRSPVESDRFINAAYVKEAMAQWYNKKSQALLDGWLDIIFTDSKEIEIAAYGNNIQGFNANFKLKREVIFSHTA